MIRRLIRGSLSVLRSASVILTRAPSIVRALHGHTLAVVIADHGVDQLEHLLNREATPQA